MEYSIRGWNVIHPRMNIFCTFESFETIGGAYWEGDERHTRMNFHQEMDSSIHVVCTIP